ncbi:MAG: hypothetical protein M5R40_10535 [Anaerolineae bacterium]|nr:hypothetical protein [Anaerolineae bacterium]
MTSKAAPFFDYWFAPRAQCELMALLRAIEAHAAPDQRDFFTLAFSAIIITKSGGVSMARDLAHTRPHRVMDKRPRDAVNHFRRRVTQNLLSLGELDARRPRRPAPVDVLRGDARALPLADGFVDLIVTSPPYAANAIDYMRAHKFSLAWLGQPVGELAALRGQYVGGERLREAALTPAQRGPLPPAVQDVVARLRAVDARKARVLHKYYSEMGAVLCEMYRALRPGGVAVLVVGTSTMRGMDVETPRCLAEIAQASAGFELVDVAARALDRNRRMMPARADGRGAGIERRMHQEHVIGLCRPC